MRLPLKLNKSHTGFMSAIDGLLAFDNSLKRRAIELPNGEEFDFWLSPLTAAVRAPFAGRWSRDCRAAAKA